MARQQKEGLQGCFSVVLLKGFSGLAARELIEKAPHDVEGLLRRELSFSGVRYSLATALSALPPNILLVAALSSVTTPVEKSIV